MTQKRSNVLSSLFVFGFFQTLFCCPGEFKMDDGIWCDWGSANVPTSTKKQYQYHCFIFVPTIVIILAYPPHRKFGGIVRFHHTSTQITFSSSASFLLFLIFRIWPWNLVWMSYLRVVRCKFRFHSVSNWMAWYMSSDPHMHLAALHHTCDLNIGFHMSR